MNTSSVRELESARSPDVKHPTATMSKPEAERLTERLRLLGGTITEQMEKVLGLLETAQNGSAHEVLGFKSWTAYVADTFKGTPLVGLGRDDRRDLVLNLADAGMSTRAIGDVLDVNQSTVSRDLASAGDALASPDGGSGGDARSIMGKDGKTYATAPKATKASALPPKTRFDQEVEALSRHARQTLKLARENNLRWTPSKVSHTHRTQADDLRSLANLIDPPVKGVEQ